MSFLKTILASAAMAATIFTNSADARPIHSLTSSQSSLLMTNPICDLVFQKYNMDLSPFTDTYRLDVEYGEGVYYLTMCGTPNRHCHGALCQITPDLKTHSLFDFNTTPDKVSIWSREEGIVNISFQNGDNDCRTSDGQMKTAEVMLDLQCQPSSSSSTENRWAIYQADDCFWTVEIWNEALCP